MDVIARLRADVSDQPYGQKRKRMDLISAESGIPPKTLLKVIYGETKYLSYPNVLKLADFFARNERRVTPDRRQSQ